MIQSLLQAEFWKKAGNATYINWAFKVSSSVSPAPILFLAITILMLHPILKPGYILTGDMVFPPYSNFRDLFFGSQEFLPNYVSGHLPLYGLMSFASLLIPMWAVQKLLILAIFMISAQGSRLLAIKAGAIGQASMYAGLLYAFNPFVQTRLLEGHWKLLIGYALLPFAILSFWNFLKNPNSKALNVSVIMAILIASTSIHVLAILILIYVFISAEHFVQNPKAIKITTLAWLSIMCGALILLNAYWWVPYLFADSTIMDQFTRVDLEVFSSPKTGLSNILETIGMYGYWDEARYFLTKDAISYWPILATAFLTLSIFGATLSWSNNRRRILTSSLTMLFFIGLILSPGVSSIFPEVIESLYEHFEAFRGFREPQKFTILIIIWLSIMGAFGLTELRRLLNPTTQNIIVFLACALVILYSITMFNGVSNQLTSTYYPSDWEKASELIHEDSEKSNILVLPWEEYIELSWTKSQVNNPSWTFFPGRVISARHQSKDPVQHYMTELLRYGNEFNNFGKMVAPLGVKYTVLLKESNYQQYDFLHQSVDLDVVLDNEKLILFKNANKVGLVSGANSIRIIEGFRDLIQAEKSGETANEVWIQDRANLTLPNIPEEPQGTCNEIVAEETYRLFSASIRIPAQSDCKYLILSRSHPSWLYMGNKGIENIAGVKVFKASNEESHITLESYKFQLLGYGVTVISLIALIIFSFLLRIRKKTTLRNSSKSRLNQNTTE
tara:strand:+ start:14277 stop:16463 length:2187 start_codon:yes stop_codon:yes gene_type:complete